METAPFGAVFFVLDGRGGPPSDIGHFNDQNHNSFETFTWLHKIVVLSAMAIPANWVALQGIGQL